MKPAGLSTIRQATAENRSTRISVAALLISNAIPLFGVIFLRWDIFTIMFLFWFENIVIGGFNVMKMLKSEGTVLPPTWPPQLPRFLPKLFYVPFFAIHYGIFTLVHGVFVFALFGGDMFRGGGSSVSVGRLLFHTLPVPIFAIILSHGISYYVNYIKQGEYRMATLPQLMQAPYGRIIVLHITILAGAFLIAALGAPWTAIAVLVVVKTLLDVGAHVRERTRNRPAVVA